MIKIHAEYNPHRFEAKLYAYCDQRNVYYTIQDGRLVQHAETPGQFKELPPLLTAPIQETREILDAIAKQVQEAGGINQEQRNAGKLEAMREEIEWLRPLISGLITKLKP